MKYGFARYYTPICFFLLGADAFSTVVSTLARYSETWRCVGTVQTIVITPPLEWVRD